jgi:hypothetical protein
MGGGRIIGTINCNYLAKNESKFTAVKFMAAYKFYSFSWGKLVNLHSSVSKLQKSVKI